MPRQDDRDVSAAGNANLSKGAPALAGSDDRGERSAQDAAPGSLTPPRFTNLGPLERVRWLDSAPAGTEDIQGVVHRREFKGPFWGPLKRIHTREEACQQYLDKSTVVAWSSIERIAWEDDFAYYFPSRDFQSGRAVIKSDGTLVGWAGLPERKLPAGLR